MTKASTPMLCPCGRGPYAKCCEPLHLGAAAPTAEALMRSRYSAYVLQLANYILATWHPGTRPAELSFEGEQTRWLGLDVRRHAEHGDTATVEFAARYKITGRAFRLHELSRFVREEISGEASDQPRWYYVDGDLFEK